VRQVPLVRKKEMLSQNDMEAMRLARVRQLFGEFQNNDRSETGVLKFYCWLQDHYPHLLPPAHVGDAFEHLKVDLSGLYT
jgi:hypothetical protein